MLFEPDVQVPHEGFDDSHHWTPIVEAESHPTFHEILTENVRQLVGYSALKLSLVSQLSRDAHQVPPDSVESNASLASNS